MATTTWERPQNQITEEGNEAPATLRSRAGPNSYRTTARVVGVVYLAGFVVGIVGNLLIQSVLGAPNHLATVTASGMTVAIGAMLWLTAVAGDAAHGVLLFPVLKRHHERLAVGYLGARIVDAVFIAVSMLFVLLQMPLGRLYLTAAAPNAFYLQALSTLLAQAHGYAYSIGMIALGVAGLLLNYTFYRARLVPRLVAVWGLAGYAILVCGMASAVLGSGLGLASSIPGGLWEVFMGVWLIAKGFRSPAIASEPAATAR